MWGKFSWKSTSCCCACLAGWSRTTFFITILPNYQYIELSPNNHICPNSGAEGRSRGFYCLWMAIIAHILWPLRILAPQAIKSYVWGDLAWSIEGLGWLARRRTENGISHALVIAPQKGNGTNGCMTLGHTNGLILSLQNLFLHHEFPLFHKPHAAFPFSCMQRKGLPIMDRKVHDTGGVYDPGVFKLNIWSPQNLFS